MQAFSNLTVDTTTTDPISVGHFDRDDQQTPIISEKNKWPTTNIEIHNCQRGELENTCTPQQGICIRLLIVWYFICDLCILLVEVLEDVDSAVVAWGSQFVGVCRRPS